MIIVGLIVLAAAVAAAVILIGQNRDSRVHVHALGHIWSGHLYWLVVAGLNIALASLLGLAMMRAGVTHARRRRRERARLLAENERLTGRVPDPADSSFFSEHAPPSDIAAPQTVPTEKTRFLRRGHHDT